MAHVQNSSNGDSSDDDDEDEEEDPMEESLVNLVGNTIKELAPAAQRKYSAGSRSSSKSWVEWASSAWWIFKRSWMPTFRWWLLHYPPRHCSLPSSSKRRSPPCSPVPALSAIDRLQRIARRLEKVLTLLLLVATNAKPLFLAHIDEPVVKPLVKR